MSTPPDVAFAVPFTWSPGSYDLRFTFAIGASPVDVTVPSGVYRMNLAPSSTDFLRVLAARANAALVASGRAETVTVSLSPSTGRVTLAISATASWAFSATLRDALGLASSTASAVTSVTGTEPPRDLYLCAGGDSAGWQRREQVAGALNAAGRAFAVRSGITHESDEITLEFIPSTPEERALAGEVWSPWLATPGVTLPWSWARFWETALAQTVAYARHWQAVMASTSERYDLVTVDPAVFRAPDARHQFPSLTTWRVLRLPLARTGTETRA